jgi:hypothetical protein
VHAGRTAREDRVLILVLAYMTLAFPLALLLEGRLLVPVCVYVYVCLCACA